MVLGILPGHGDLPSSLGLTGHSLFLIKRCGLWGTEDGEVACHTERRHFATSKERDECIQTVSGCGRNAWE
jgi:hypothetical protein